MIDRLFSMSLLPGPPRYMLVRQGRVKQETIQDIEALFKDLDQILGSMFVAAMRGFLGLRGCAVGDFGLEGVGW